MKPLGTWKLSKKSTFLQNVHKLLNPRCFSSLILSLLPTGANPVLFPSNPTFETFLELSRSALLRFGIHFT